MEEYSMSAQVWVDATSTLCKLRVALIARVPKLDSDFIRIKFDQETEHGALSVIRPDKPRDVVCLSIWLNREEERCTFDYPLWIHRFSLHPPQANFKSQDKITIADPRDLETVSLVLDRVPPDEIYDFVVAVTRQLCV
jgi:hypothetical protein